MKFHVLTLFPEMIMGGLDTSIIGRAIANNLIDLNAVDIRDYTLDKHGKVDDYPYGGGAGMLMQAQPVYDAYQSIAKNIDTHKKIRTIYVTPQGTPFTQLKAKELAEEENLVILCGHYEGIDERVLEEIVTDYISIGDYVLTGGELPAMVMIDAISRLVPGVLNNDISAETESFHNDLLEYPQYSRPEVWRDKKVPEILLSGNHRKIAQWRLEQSQKRTSRIRPDLYKKYEEKQNVIAKLSKRKRDNIQLIEVLRRGMGEILYAKNDNYLIWDRESKACMISVKNNNGCVLEEMFRLIPEKTNLFLTSQEFLNPLIMERFSLNDANCYLQASYTKRDTLPVSHKDIRVLDETYIEYILKYYHYADCDYIKKRIYKKTMYGAFQQEQIVGFIGMHEEGSIGMLFVEEPYRKSGIGRALLAFQINRMKELGWIPFSHILVENTSSVKLHEEMGLNISNMTIWWLSKTE